MGLRERDRERREATPTGPWLINTWAQLMAAGGDQVAIGYYPPQPRSVTPACYRVWRIKDGRALETDKDAAWYDNHQKTFNCFTDKASKATALAQAMAWADATYGKRDWVRNRMGDWVARETNTKFPLRKARREPA